MNKKKICIKGKTVVGEVKNKVLFIEQGTHLRPNFHEGGVGGRGDRAGEVRPDSTGGQVT